MSQPYLFPGFEAMESSPLQLPPTLQERFYLRQRTLKRLREHMDSREWQRIELSKEESTELVTWMFEQDETIIGLSEKLATRKKRIA